MTRAFVVLFGLSAILFATEAKAQGFFHKNRSQQYLTSAAPAYSASPSVATGTVPSSRVYSYSYYSRSALPARTYVGFGTEDFPFHGTPYGHAYDAYTWHSMSGSNSSALARYYDPPVK